MKKISCQLPGFSFKIRAFYPFGQLDKVEGADVLIVPLGVIFGIAFQYLDEYATLNSH